MKSKSPAKPRRWLEFVRRNLLENRQLVSKDESENVRAFVGSASGMAALESLVNTQILRGYEAEPDSTSGWVRRVSLPNFLAGQLAKLDEVPRLENVPPGASAPGLTMAVGSTEGWRLARFGAAFELDEQDLLSDGEINVFELALQEIGKAAKRLLPDLVYSLILENPTMADTGALFNATAITTAGGHANLGTGALSDTNLDTGLAAVAGQVAFDSDGLPVHQNGAARYLVVAPALLGLACRLVRAMSLENDSDLIVCSETRIGPAGLLDPRDDETIRTGASTRWMLAAPESRVPSIVAGALNGVFEPRVRKFEAEAGQWGAAFDISLSLAVCALDWRGLYWSSGTA